MPGQRRFNGNLRRLRVPDFPDHDNVRILAQNGPERVGEGESDVFLGGHLIDARNLKLHRVFHRDDIISRIVQLIERGVKRGGLARTGRAGDQNQAVGGINGRLEILKRFGVQPQLVDAGRQIGLVQHAKHDFLPVNRGQNRNPKIIILAADLDAQASVLRQAALGDVQVAHDLEARRQCELHLLGRGGGVQQNPVHAIAQAHCFFKRLQMDIAGAVFDGLHDHQVGQLDDRRLLAGGGQLVETDVLVHRFDVLHRCGLFLSLLLFLGGLNDVLHGTILGRVQQIELVRNGFFGGDQRGDLQPGDPPHVVDGQDIERVSHRQKQPAIQLGNREDPVALHHLAGDQLQQLREHGGAGDVDRGDVQHTPHADREILFAHIGFFDDELDQAGALFFLLLQQFRHLPRIQQPILDQGVDNPLPK